MYVSWGVEFCWCGVIFFGMVSGANFFWVCWILVVVVMVMVVKRCARECKFFRVGWNFFFFPWCVCLCFLSGVVVVVYAIYLFFQEAWECFCGAHGHAC